MTGDVVTPHRVTPTEAEARAYQTLLNAPTVTAEALKIWRSTR